MQKARPTTCCWCVLGFFAKISQREQLVITWNGQNDSCDHGLLRIQLQVLNVANLEWIDDDFAYYAEFPNLGTPQCCGSLNLMLEHVLIRSQVHSALPEAAPESIPVTSTSKI